MYKIKSLEKYRWFIWTIVISVTSLVSLAVYIQYISSEDSYDLTYIVGRYVPDSKVAVSQGYINNTVWTASNGEDTLLSFLTTKKNDSKHVNHDYKIAADSRVQEIGYWKVVSGEIILVPTKIYATPQHVVRILIRDNMLKVYTKEKPKGFSLVKSSV